MYQTVYVHRGSYHVYKTTSYTDHHKFLCDKHEGKTYKDAQIYTEVCPGFPLDKPIIRSGTRV